MQLLHGVEGTDVEAVDMGIEVTDVEMVQGDCHHEEGGLQPGRSNYSTSELEQMLESACESVELKLKTCYPSLSFN